jgi:hypothetical protein
MLVELPFTVMRHASIPCTDPELNRIRKQLACVTPGGMCSRFAFVHAIARGRRIKEKRERLIA